MRRRVFSIVAAISLTGLLAGPALGATGATQVRVQSEGLYATFSNSWDDTGLPPGDYFGAILGASVVVSHGDGAVMSKGLCLGIDETRLHEDGSWSLERSYAACGPIDALSVRGDLGSAHLVASFAATCEQYRGASWDCGQMDIDLTLTGVGPITTFHDTTVTGAPGPGRSIVQASGSSRSAVYANGYVTLGDRSFTSGGAVLVDAGLFDSHRGTVTIGG